MRGRMPREEWGVCVHFGGLAVEGRRLDWVTSHTGPKWTDKVWSGARGRAARGEMDRKPCGWWGRTDRERGEGATGGIVWQLRDGLTASNCDKMAVRVHGSTRLERASTRINTRAGPQRIWNCN
ncbi:hypothetical protein B0J17DRAFT_447027 [Rhizoctonia solani]|nr:hypothetical protein B0J17DRAFT_447027 [Rhizoctonia solani]